MSILALVPFLLGVEGEDISQDWTGLGWVERTLCFVALQYNLGLLEGGGWAMVRGCVFQEKPGGGH